MNDKTRAAVLDCIDELLETERAFATVYNVTVEARLRLLGSLRALISECEPELRNKESVN